MTGIEFCLREWYNFPHGYPHFSYSVCSEAVKMSVNARKTSEKHRTHSRSLRRGFLSEFDAAVAGIFAAAGVGSVRSAG